MYVYVHVYTHVKSEETCENHLTHLMWALEMNSGFQTWEQAFLSADTLHCSAL